MKSVLIGEVIKPQGVQGEVKVYPMTDDPERYKRLKKVLLTDGNNAECFQVQNVRVDPKGLVYLILQGITTREAAEKYRGWHVIIDRSQVAPLKDRWYYFELEGLEVYEDDVFLGVLTKVLATGSNDVYVVEKDKREICIPALKSVVKKVDVLGQRMDVILPPGLLDD